MNEVNILDHLHTRVKRTVYGFSSLEKMRTFWMVNNNFSEFLLLGFDDYNLSTFLIGYGMQQGDLKRLRQQFGVVHHKITKKRGFPIGVPRTEN
jgi:hypothetical protein